MHMYVIYTQPHPFFSCRRRGSVQTILSRVLGQCVSPEKLFPVSSDEKWGKYKLPAPWMWPTEHNWALQSFVIEMKGSVNPRSLSLFLQLASVRYMPHFAVFHFYTTTHRSVAESRTNLAHFFCGPRIILHRTAALYSAAGQVRLQRNQCSEAEHFTAVDSAVIFHCPVCLGCHLGQLFWLWLMWVNHGYWGRHKVVYKLM